MNPRVLGWWYICIGAGFVALGARAFIAGASTFSVVLRFMIAAGFLVLGGLSLTVRKR